VPIGRGLVFLAIGALLAVAACGGDSARTTPVAQETPIPAAGSSASPDAADCATATRRDGHAPEPFVVFLGQPPCLDLSNNSDVAITFARVGRPETSKSLNSAVAALQIPDAYSPYGSDGCTTDPQFSVNLTLSLSPAAEAIGRALVACQGQQSDEGCGVPDTNGFELRLSSAAGNPCIFWEDTPNEVGYRIELTYTRISQVFAYVIPRDSSVFNVPFEAAPRLTESTETCLARKDVDLLVFALTDGGGESLIGSRSIIAECHG
jgi:hypothetical protein